jgi:hypothetical protein
MVTWCTIIAFNKSSLLLFCCLTTGPHDWRLKYRDSAHIIHFWSWRGNFIKRDGFRVGAPMLCLIHSKYAGLKVGLCLKV